MKISLPFRCLGITAAAAFALISSQSARANSSTFSGNTQTGFGNGGAVGNGSLTVSDDGSGGVDFQFTPGGSSTNFDGGNDLVIYIDNSTGGGLSTTASLNPSTPGDGGQQAVTGLASSGNGGGRSTLAFGGILAPQYAIDMETGYGDVFAISSGTANFVDGNNPGAGPGAFGAIYTFVSGVANLDLPAADFGLTSFSGDTITVFATLISESGYRSNEDIGTVNSTAEGWGNTITVTGANTFTTAAPEPSAPAMMIGASVLGSLFMLRRKRS